MRGVQFQGAARDLPRVDRRVVHGAAAHHLIGDQASARVQEQHVELLRLLETQSGAQVIGQSGPGVQHGFRRELPAQQPRRRRVRQFQRGDTGIAQTVDGS